MYSIAGYGVMMADRLRMAAYSAALERAVRPGSVVLDIGCGTGIFSLLACRFGAGKVYAIEPDDSIQIARQLARDNGCADRIEFIQDLSTRVTLPQRADVMISDLRSVLPLFGAHIPSIVDARERLLRPGGVQIGRADRVHVSIVAAPDAYRRFFLGWDRAPAGLDLRAGRRAAAATIGKIYVRPEQLLAPPREWLTIDYRSVTAPHADGVLEYEVTRDGEGSGLVAWFDADLDDSAALSNNPAAPRLLWGQAFFPWTQPVALRAGQRVRVALAARYLGGDYIWRWRTEIEPVAGESPMVFDQSSFRDHPLPLAQLRQRAETYVPALGRSGEVDRWILSAMDGTASAGDIARRAAAAFPDRFPDWRAAHARVADLIARYAPPSTS